MALVVFVIWGTTATMRASWAAARHGEAPASNELGLMVTATGFAVLLGAGAGVALRRPVARWLAERRLGPVSVTVDPASPRPGDELVVTLALCPRAFVEVEPPVFVVTAIESTIEGEDVRERVLFTATVTPETPRELRAGEALSVEARLALAGDAPVSRVDGPHRIDWTLEVTLPLPGRPAWSVKRRLVVVVS